MEQQVIKLRKIDQYLDWKFIRKATIVMLPLIVQSLLNALVNLVDTFMIGAFLGQETLNGAGAANNVLSIVQFLIFSINAAGSIYASQYYGAGNITKMREINNIRILCNVSFTIFVSIFILVFREQIIKVMVSSDSSVTLTNFDYQQTIEAGSHYLIIVMFVYPIMGITLAIYQNMNECGKTKMPLLLSVIPLAINSSLNLVFLIVAKMGVDGVAFSTLISRIVEIIIVISYLAIFKPIFRPLAKFWYIDKHLLKRVLKSFIPIGMGNLLFVFSVNIQTVIYSKYGGANILSASIVVFAIMQIFYAVFNGYYSGLVPYFIGRELGAGNFEEVGKNFKKIMVLIFIFSIVLSAMILGMSFFIFDLLFSKQIGEEALGHARFFMAFQSIAYIFLSYSIVFFGTLRSGGHARLAAIVDIACTWIFIVLVPFLISIITNKYYPDFNYRYVFIVATVAELFQFVITAIIVSKVNWKRKVV